MTSRVNEIAKCEVCSSKHLESVLKLGMHPLCDDLIRINENRQCEEYPIEILYCPECRTAHQRFQVNKEALFPASYHYRAKNTADVLDGMELFVKTCNEKISGVENKKIVDIGCNDGSLLTSFRKQGAITYGVEPTNAYLDAEAAGHIVINDYLSEGVAEKFVADHGNADVITFTNVFAHIEDLEGLLRSVNVLRHSKSVIMIENHYLGSVLRSKQFDTFYHEHPRTYSYGSFVRIAETLGMEIGFAEFPSRYGGNIRVLLTPIANPGQYTHYRADALNTEEEFISSAFKALSDEVDHWQKSKKEEILTAVETYGPLVAKAFPGRAAIPVKLLGLDHTMVKAAYEKPGSQKIGHWIPGTKIPIVSDSSILEDLNSGAPVLNFAWHIEDEIKKYMEDKGFKGTFINII